jgi:starch synthase (maltosyl-transferring)
MDGRKRVIIENVKPEINKGRFPIKRVIDDTVKVTADIFCDGHDAVRAEVLFKLEGEKEWNIVEMEHRVNDSWSGTFQAIKQGRYLYTLRAWPDKTKTWYSDLLKKIKAEVDITSDLQLGIQIINDITATYNNMNIHDSDFLNEMATYMASDHDISLKIQRIKDKTLYQILHAYPLRTYLSQYHLELEALCERKKAGFSTWYEFFPRSLKGKSGHGTLRDCIEHLKYVADMGFDVIYLPPIHPIGKKHRKGKNNALNAQPGDTGSPWAIGSADGGHKAIHKQLGYRWRISANW